MRPAPGPAGERRLLKLFRRLAPADRETLLAFAAFLGERAEPASDGGAPREPRHRPRPERESVVAAIKRLSQTYEMLDRGPMLEETSTLMSAHILQGRSATEVIDEIEALFARHYQDYLSRHRSEG